LKLKKGPAPLYYQLATILRRQVLAGEMTSENFLTERELCKEYEVSRTTVREALDVLETENLIKREQGRGTLVTLDRQAAGVFTAYGRVEELLSIAQQTKLKLTSKSVVAADREIAADMGIQEGDNVCSVEGIRYQFEQDYTAFWKAFVPSELCDQLPLNLTQPIYFLEVEKASMEVVSKATQITFAMAATPSIAKSLNLKVGHPLLVVKRIFMTSYDKVLEVAISYIPGDKSHFKINLAREVETEER